MVPLTPLVFHVLLSLVDQQSHGYAITCLGRHVIQAETHRMSKAVRLAEGLLMASPTAEETSSK